MELQVMGLLVRSELYSRRAERSRNPRRKQDRCRCGWLQGWGLGKIERYREYLSDKMDSKANSVSCQIIAKVERGIAQTLLLINTC
jgi:hypothetical protein